MTIPSPGSGEPDPPPAARVPAARAPELWPAARPADPPPTPRRRQRPPERPSRHPAVALPAVILFGLLAAFFAWQSAEPLWLAAGHGVPGTATVTHCDAATGTTTPAGHSGGTAYRCVTFEATSGAFQAPDVTLLGADESSLAAGASVPARMVAADRDRAYLAHPTGLHLRWTIGLLLVLACGAGIAWVTGARRLPEPRSRRRAVLLSFAGPLLLTVGFVIAAV